MTLNIFHAVAGDETDGLPKVPPKIDRQKKPSRRSASERLFGNGEVSGNYMNSNDGNATATPPSGKHRNHSNSLDRHTHIRDMKLVKRALFCKGFEWGGL